jgi:hypothetical protein
MPRFQLETADGKPLDPVELGRHDWPPCSVIHRGDSPNLRVFGVRQERAGLDEGVTAPRVILLGRSKVTCASKIRW